MKRFFAFIALAVLLAGCTDKGWHGTCAGCEEYGSLSGSCPCCGAALCKSCLFDAKYTWESAYEKGSSAGYGDGYDEGYSTGYNDGLWDGAEGGYSDGYADALKEYGITEE